jgi:hypothetical protein
LSATTVRYTIQTERNMYGTVTSFNSDFADRQSE